ncbi:MAG: TetR/AcrR family transcriptional regulator [Gaiella sp.]
MAAIRQPGRPRDAAIDTRALAVAREHLAERGYEALSLAAVAAEAGTTRQALYRRWPAKADLATAAIAALSRAEARPPTDDPFADLVAELAAFRRGIERPDGVSMVGTMLLRSADPALVALFRERIVAPRRARLRAILERAREARLVAADGDLEIVLSQLTGSWYAYALAGERPPRDWARRVAVAAWRALGGVAPQR